jgi:hypothetical protein
VQFELKPEEIELLREAVESAIAELTKEIAGAGLQVRQGLRERRVTLRWLCEALPAHA